MSQRLRELLEARDRKDFGEYRRLTAGQILEEAMNNADRITAESEARSLGISENDALLPNQKDQRMSPKSETANPCPKPDR